MSFEPGHVVADKYRIVRMIGRGGVGEVYEGENLRIRRKVAIKTLKAEFVAKADIVQRFEREAQAAGRIGSQHIVEVLDLGDLPDGSRFLVMEYLEGETLSRRIRTVGKMTAIDTAQIVLQLLEGLAGAHAAGIVHRDLKPANIFLVPRQGESFVKILDFGVSKFNTLASDELAMTKTGVVVGTPYYMAPEQAKGARSVDGRADLYAVGVIAYECVTGQVPFSAQTFNELLFKIVLEAPPPIEQFAPDIDPAFAALVRKAMNREPNMRFQTAQEFVDALAAWLHRASGGRLGGDLAQTTAFAESAGSTVILDVSPRQPGAAMPPGAPMHVPPPHAGPAHAAAAPLPHGVPSPEGAPFPGAPSPAFGAGPGGPPIGTWTPGAAAPPAARSRAAPIAIAAAIGLAIVGGGAFALTRAGSDPPAEPAATGAPAPPVAAAPTGSEASGSDAPVDPPPERPDARDEGDEPGSPPPPETGAAAAPQAPSTNVPPPSRPPPPSTAKTGSGGSTLPPRPPGTAKPKPGAGRPISGEL